MNLGQTKTIAVVALGVLFLTSLAVPSAMAFQRSTMVQQRSGIRPVKIDTIYGATDVHIDVRDNYRVRINNGAAWPIQYYWDMGDGTLSIGNNIVHGYKRPGRFRVRVWARNSTSVDSSEIIVSVRANELMPVEPQIVAAKVETSPSTQPRRPRQNTSVREAEIADDIEEGQAFAWVLGTHLEKASAERSLREYRSANVPGVRILEDRSGKGARAYRVAIGNYVSLDSAVRSKEKIEDLVGTKVWLFAFSQ